MKKIVSVTLALLCCTSFVSCGCSNRWVKVLGHYYKPEHYEQYNSKYYSYGRWVEEQKYLRVECACGTTDIKVTESLYDEVKDGDSVYWHRAEHTVSVKHKSWY